MLPADAVIATLRGPRFVQDIEGPTAVFTWDGERVTVGYIDVLPGQNAVPFAVTLDDDTTVLVDREALLIRRTGSPAYAEDLKAGDSLLPLYTKTDGQGYSTYQEPGDWHKGAETVRDSYRWRRVSRMVAEWKLGRRCLPGDVVSFVNGDRVDCDPENLKIEQRKPRKQKVKAQFAEPYFVADRFIKKHNHKVMHVQLDISREMFSIRGLKASNLSVGGVFISVDTTE